MQGKNPFAFRSQGDVSKGEVQGDLLDRWTGAEDTELIPEEL